MVSDRTTPVRRPYRPLGDLLARPEPEVPCVLVQGTVEERPIAARLHPRQQGSDLLRVAATIGAIVEPVALRVGALDAADRYAAPPHGMGPIEYVAVGKRTAHLHRFTRLTLGMMMCDPQAEAGRHLNPSVRTATQRPRGGWWSRPHRRRGSAMNVLG